MGFRDDVERTALMGVIAIAGGSLFRAQVRSTG